jgi:hypothetical protein
MENRVIYVIAAGFLAEAGRLCGECPEEMQIPRPTGRIG